jgi:replicative DNA helicase
MSDQKNYNNKETRKEVDIEKPVFDIEFQAGLLKLCLKDDYFCAQLVRYLNSDKDLHEFNVFGSPQLHYIFEIVCKSMEEYKTRPAIAMIRQAILEFAEDEREPYFRELERIETADLHNEEYYKRFIKAFVQQVKMAKGLKKTTQTFKENPLEAPNLMQKVIDSIFRIQFEQEDIVSLSQVYTLLEKDDSKIGKIPTGLQRLDDDLRGGFPRETLVTVLGSSNAGKSIFCTSLGCSALRSGNKVLHINLEGTRDEAAIRYLSNLADIPFYKIEEKSWNISEKARMDDAIEKYSKNVKIRNMLNFGVTIEDVIAYCREAHKEFAFDMLIVDYGQLLKTKEKHDKGFDRQTEAYRGLASLSAEFSCVVISPAQSTRDGIKKQNDFSSKGRQKDEKLPVLRSGDLADCIEIARVSAIILTLNRTEDEERRGWLRVFLEKQRRGKKAITYGIKAHYDRSNLIVNDYYDPNTTIHKSDDEKDDSPSVADVKERKLGDLAARPQAPTAESKAVASAPVKKKVEIPKSENSFENDFNDILMEVEQLQKERDEIKAKELTTGKSEQETDKAYEKIKKIITKIKELKEIAIDLLPHFMPQANEELFKTIKASIKDKNNNSSGTADQDQKTELVYRQMALVFEK